MGARAAVALYVALALHLLALLLLMLVPSPQAPLGAGQGLGLGLQLAGREGVLAPRPPRSDAEASALSAATARKPEPIAERPVQSVRARSEQAAAEPRRQIRLETLPAVPGDRARAARPGFAEPATSPEGAGGGEVDSYFTRLRQHLHRFRRDLPVGAEAGGAEVALVVQADGHVSDLRLARGSRSSVLDEEAVALVLRAQPLPLPPDGEALRLVVPIYVDP